ncbi:hypothetical protein BKG94_07340 [Rodentibacter ratti]|uniref:hypothetical protein n=1 Tax=Rodentibacter ratti TaxID=1906745 RepID=UPI0009874D74|nr:hypothetical protein [Rodentibacter ratti]OOF88336.1 hypothetical protein BKG94_07340 [Rodentibacter ratti]
MILTIEQVHDIFRKMSSFGKRTQEEELNFLLSLWNDLPEPKNKQPEQISNWIIDCIFNNLFDNKYYIQAKEWALRALNNDTAQEGAYEYFQMGRVCYELEEYDEAMKYFSIAYDRGKKRAFKEFDKKYWEFYSKNKK